MLLIVSYVVIKLLLASFNKFIRSSQQLAIWNFKLVQQASKVPFISPTTVSNSFTKGIITPNPASNTL